MSDYYLEWFDVAAIPVLYSMLLGGFMFHPI